MKSSLELLCETHQLLSSLNIKRVYTGGATIPLYLDDPTSPDVRTTLDADLVVQITTESEYYELEERLRDIGLTHDTSEDAPICRWTYEHLLIDVMPLEKSVLGFSNRWHKPGFNHAVERSLPDNKNILVFSEPYLLASKIEAFRDRGEEDYWASKDFEDIVRLLDGCTTLEKAIKRSEEDVKRFIQKWFRAFLELDRADEYVSAHLPIGAGGTERSHWILKDMEEIEKQIRQKA